MAKRFEGKTVFITGASAGIGEGLALEFAKQGAQIALAARRKERLAKIAAQIEKLGAKALVIECDVTKEETVLEAVAQTVNTFGAIDIAIANAGFGISRIVQKLNVEDFRRQFETNYFGALYTTYAVLPHLEKSKGTLVFMSSIAGRIGVAAMGAYCSSKFALNGLAETLYYELAPKKISVVCIQPGMVESDFSRVDNQGVFHQNQKDKRPKHLVMSRDQAVSQMVKAIYKRKFDVVITTHGKILVWLKRHFPRTLRFIMNIGAKKRIPGNS